MNWLRSSALGKLAVGLAAVIVLLFASLQLRWPIEKHLGYWAISDTMLGVVVLDAPGVSCAVPEVEESSDAVRIHAECEERVVPVPQEGIAKQNVFQVMLQAPLGSRAVYDGTGTLASSCQKPAPFCSDYG